MTTSTSRRLAFTQWQCLVGLLLFLGLLPGAAVAEAEAKPPNSCVTCHSDRNFFVRHKKLFFYYRDWLKSSHYLSGMTCDQCHGGNPLANTMQDAHQGALPVSDPASRLFYKNQPETCGECHENEAEQFKLSKHYKNLRDELGAPSCSTCHEAMNLSPYSHEIVENTCRLCHYENNKEGLPMVAGKASDILHRLNISKGYLNWTRLYYRSKDWPGNSKQLVASLARAYDAIVTQGHSFDLENTEQVSVDLLSRLKDVYRQTEDRIEQNGD